VSTTGCASSPRRATATGRTETRQRRISKDRRERSRFFQTRSPHPPLASTRPTAATASAKGVAPRHAGGQERHGDVLGRGQGRQEVELLEHEAEVLPPKADTLLARQIRVVPSEDREITGARREEPGDHRDQRGLARAARPRGNSISPRRTLRSTPRRTSSASGPRKRTGSGARTCGSASRECSTCIPPARSAGRFLKPPVSRPKTWSSPITPHRKFGRKAGNIAPSTRAILPKSARRIFIIAILAVCCHRRSTWSPLFAKTTGCPHLGRPREVEHPRPDCGKMAGTEPVEAGMVGQVLYLEAKEVGIRSTGIGCDFDDSAHQAFGTASMEWQRLPLHGGWPGRGPSADDPACIWPGG
jgi:hypothetical protein